MYDRRASQSILNSFHRYIEPLLIAVKKRDRLLESGIRQAGELPVARLDFHLNEQHCHAECGKLIARYLRYYSKFNRVTVPGNRRLKPFLGTADILLVSRFSDFSAYERCLSKHSGNFRRSANKASKLGFYTKFFDERCFLQDISMIKKSKKFRSFGPVIHAFLPPDKIPKTQVTAVPSSAPNCLRHWELCFGVFQAALTGCETIKRETLVGYAKLHRIGNTLRYAEKMGHGEYLRQGIMMLLHRELMKWLLDESNTLAQGIDALTYGAIEQGGHGLMFWKKKAQFQPCLLDLDQQDGGAE